MLRSLLEFKPEEFGLPPFEDNASIEFGINNMPTGSVEKLRIKNNKHITHCLFDMDGLLLGKLILLFIYFPVQLRLFQVIDSPN